MIKLNNISKTYKVYKREAGIKNAVKSFFSKKYEMVHALDNISFNINDGEMVGYIGPNGAGKSTTIKIMCGILNPDSGECIIDGKVPWKNRVDFVKDIGVVFGNRTQLWWDVPVIDSFELLKEVYKIPIDIYNRQKNRLVEMLEIGEIIKTPARNLSLGQRMRCEIASAFLHNPKTVFLDEPTIGLDAVSKLAVRNFIKQMNKENNTTIILTTHDTQDIDALTDRIVLIGKGKILLDGKLDELKKKFKEKYVTIEYNGNSVFELCEGLKFIEKQDNIAKIAVDLDKMTLPKTMEYLSKLIEITDFDVSETPIDEIVVKMYKEYKI